MSKSYRRSIYVDGGSKKANRTLANRKVRRRLNLPPTHRKFVHNGGKYKSIFCSHNIWEYKDVAVKYDSDGELTPDYIAFRRK